MDELLEQAQKDYPIGTKFKVAHIDHNPSEYIVAGGWRWEDNEKRVILCDVVGSATGYAPCLKYKNTWAPIIELGNIIFEPLIFN